MAVVLLKSFSNRKGNNVNSFHRSAIRTVFLLICIGCGAQTQSPKEQDADINIPSFRVSPEGAFCSIGSYDVSPESPDGTKILYMRWNSPPTASSGGDGAVWYCNRDLTGHTKIIDLERVRIHNASGIAWVDNHRIQAYGTYKGDLRGAAVVNINGKIEQGPYNGMDILHEAVNGLVPMSSDDDKSRFGKGVFILDAATGEVRKICDARSFINYAGRMPDMRDPAHWRLSHPTWSRDGKYIAVCLENDSSPYGEYLFSFHPDFSDLVFFGKKPTHFNWYDDHSSIYGGDRWVQMKDNALRRWTRDGKWIEDLGGSPANHSAMSPDRSWFAGESWYDNDPVLYLYRSGSTGKGIVVMSHKFKSVTWEKRAHVNPAFSCDSKRLYYNRATSETMNEVWYADLSGLSATRSK